MGTWQPPPSAASIARSARHGEVRPGVVQRLAGFEARTFLQRLNRQRALSHGRAE